jgi:hypothetical protein
VKAMSMMYPTLICSLLVGCCTAQSDENKPATPQDAAKKSALAKAKKQMLALFEKFDIQFDAKKKTLTIPVVLNSPTNDLEFLLIHRIGKTHEALLVTEAKPSVINSGLLLLGLKPGQNASFKKKEPQPSEAELRKGADPFVIVPPSGTEIYMTVSYKTEDAKTITRPVDDLLLDWQVNLPVANHKWIYIGGREGKIYRNEPDVYIADYEGNLISTCYKYPNNHMFTIVHERARDEMNWAKTAACPPPGTVMKLTFHVTKPPIIAAREVRMNREAEARKKSGETSVKDRPERNPAREGRPPPRETPPPKKGGAKKKLPKSGDAAGTAGKK